MATAPPNGNGDEPDRRMLLRRARGGGAAGGFGSGVSTSSESYDGEDEGQGSDDIIDSPPERDGNRQRLALVAMAGDANYTKEFRQDLLHKLLLRKIPLDAIARELGVSISTVQKDRIALKARLRQVARELNIDEMVGNQMAFYDDVQATSLRIASTSDMPTAMRLAGLRTSLAANADRTRFLTSAGVLDVLAYRRAENGEDLSDVQLLMRQTSEALANMAAQDAEEDRKAAPPPAPAPQPARARPKPAAFKPLTFDDKNDDEIMEL